MLLIGLSLFAHKLAKYEKYADLNEEKVMQHIEKQKILVLPIIGVILLTIAFIIQILK